MTDTIQESKLDSALRELHERIDLNQQRINFLRKHRNFLNELLESSNLCLDTWSHKGFDFNWPKRDQVNAILLHFGGKWTKTYEDNKELHYTQEIDGLRIRLYCAELPPSCKIVEERIEHPAETVTVPARTEVRRKIVCNEEDVSNE